MSVKRDFNQVAVNWDEKPRRVALAQGVAEAIRAAVPLQSTMTALDFGCGTGLVTFNLIDAIGQVVAVDSAEQMLSVTREKAAQTGVEHKLTTLLSQDGAPLDVSGTFDLIYSSMVLHHVADLPELIRELSEHLAEGGYLALADLDREDGTFHDDPTGVFHQGIDRHWLSGYFSQLGLTEISERTAHVIVKQRGQQQQDYPVFLVVGKRPRR